jgi:Tol biopolymer transport system component
MFKAARILLISGVMAVRAFGAALPPIEVVSTPYTNTPHVFGDSSGIELSADGKWAVFYSNGNGLTTNDNNGLNLDLFLRNNQTGEIELISRNTAGSSADGDSTGPMISADGRFIVFQSTADDLITGDDNESSDVFLYDRDSGKITLLSKSSGGVADGQSGAPVMTPDGRFILFESDADDLSPLDQNDAMDLYLLDRNSGELKLATLNSNNTAAASSPFPLFLGQFEGSVSGDGRFVAYLSYATNVVPKFPANASAQLFLRDMPGGTNVWISRTTNGVGAAAVSTPILSRNGAYLAFLSSKISGQGTTSPDTYLYVYATGSGELTEVQPATEFALSADGGWIAYISGNSIYLYETATKSKTQLFQPGDPINDVSSNPAISEDGNTILFTSTSTNIVSGPSGETYQLFRYDRASKQFAFLSPNLSGTSGNDDVLFPVLSGDGRAAGFWSYATDLVANDDKRANDVFIVGTSGTNTLILASTPDPRVISGTAYGESTIASRAISADGRFVAFTSEATDLVPNDNNSAADVFLRDLRTGVTKLVSVSPDAVHPLPTLSRFLALSADGGTVAFVSSNLLGTNRTQSIFAYDTASGTNTVATVLPDGTTSQGTSQGAMSADGRYLAFSAKLPNQSTTGVYLRDLLSRTTILITNASTVTAVNISPKGKYVLVSANGLYIFDWKNQKTLRFGGVVSADLALFPRDEDEVLIDVGTSASVVLAFYKFDTGTTNPVITAPFAWGLSQDGSTIAYGTRVPTNLYRVFIYDARTGTTTGLPQTDSNQLPRAFVLSADGRYVFFETRADLIGAGANGRDNIYVFDRALTNLALVSQAISGRAGDEASSNPSVSADGRTIAFQSSASDLVGNDRNYDSDVFLAHLPLTDSNQNGLEDGWEMSNFGSVGADPKADPDNDGMTNLQEYLSGTNPNDPVSALAVQSSLSPSDHTLHLQWIGIAGKSYQLQFRSAFGSGDWQNIGTAVLGAGEPLVMTPAVGVDATGFFRVEVLQ